MSVGYRAILTLPAKADAVARVEEQLRSWLKGKQQDRRSTVSTADWDGPGVHEVGAKATLTVVHAEAHGERRRTYRLREENDLGVFLVSVHVLDRRPGGRAGDSVVVEVAKLGADVDDAAQVSPPRFIRGLLDVEHASNGSVHLTSRPEIVHSDDVADVVKSISDASRTAAIIVAATPDRASQENWVKVVTSLTRESVGIAAVYVLDEPAVEEFNLRLLPSHEVPFGRVRTFLPGADLSNEEDGRRHPYLNPARLLRSVDGTQVAGPLQRVHALTLRERALVQPLPREVRRALDLLGREEQKVIRDDLVARRLQDTQSSGEALAEETVASVVLPPVPAALETVVQWPARLVRLVRTWLHRDDASDQAIDDLHRYIELQVSEKQVALEQLDEVADLDRRRTDEIADMQSRIDELELELAVEADESRRQRRTASVYEQRLRDQQRFSELTLPAEQDGWEPPDSVAELVDRLTPELGDSPLQSRVVFTGDRDLAAAVDVRDAAGRYAGSLWTYLLALYDYAETRASGEFSGNVHAYLLDPRAVGRKCPVARHASTESETVLTNRGMRNERVRPVPKDVDESGFALMDSHFKPTHSDRFAPRMHYYDDVAGSGKIYVGYIGKHLTNTKTN